MEAPEGCHRADDTSLLCLPVDKDQEEGDGGKACTSSEAAEGGQEQESEQAELQVGVAMAAVEEAGKKVEEEFNRGAEGGGEESCVGAVGPDLLGDGNREHTGAGAGAREQEKQQEIPVLVSTENVLSVSRPRHRTRFTPTQRQELENVFQDTHYPSCRAIRDLARWMGVTQEAVKDWFKIQRALHRRKRRILMQLGGAGDTQNPSP